MAVVFRRKVTLILAVLALTALGVTASPLPIRAADAVQPNIVNFQPSLGSLPSEGGTVTLTADLGASATCKLKVTPVIVGLVSSPPCLDATVSQDVLVPANHTVTPITYVFKLQAKNTLGKSVATTSVTVAPLVAPTMSDVSASPSELTPAGGTVDLSALVTGAPVCTIKVSPKVKGLNASPSCVDGHLAEQVAIPANVSTVPVTYVFRLKAKNLVGKSKATLSVMVDAIPAPSISALTVTPSTQPLAGGTVQLQASVSGDPVCTVKVSPPVPGSPFKPVCNGGNLDLPVTLPMNTGLTPIDYTFKVSASNPAAKAKAKITATVLAGDLPSITSFSPSPDSLPGTGGPITLNGALSGASSCKISVTPSISAGPWTPSCADGSLSQQVTIPQNTSVTNPVTYVFKLTGTNVSGKVTTTTQVVVAPISTPVVTAFSSTSPSDILGGPIMLSGSVANATSCSITVNPSIPGAPFGPACESGSLSQPVQLPMNTGSQPVTYTFSLTASALAGDSHVSKTSVTVPAAFPALSFIIPQTLVSPRGYPASISCPTDAFCAAVDLSGSVMVRSGDVWSAPVNVDANQLTDISCVSSTFCKAVDASGGVLTYDGSSWSSPSAISTQNLTSISCATLASCVVGAVDGTMTMWNGTTWSSAQTVSPYSISGVSCPTPTFCKAVDIAGQVISYNGVTWSSPIVVSSDAFETVSCASVTSCIAAGAMSGTSNVYKWSGSSWSTAADLGGQNVITAVSCPSAAMCMAVDDHANAYLDTSGVWSAGQAVEAGGLMSTVSCSSVARCVALSFAGGSYTWASSSPSTWTANGTIDVPSGTLVSISCARPGNCVTVSSDGSSFVWSHGSWSAPVATGLSDVTGVSCTSSTFCLATSLDGTAATFNGTSWTSTAAVPTAPPLDAVSCTSPTYCLAGSAGGDFVAFNGSSWSAPVTTPSQTAAINGISCVTSSFCAAITQGGTVWFWDGSQLTSSKLVFAAGVPGQTISCTQAKFCVVGSRDGRLATWTGGTGWKTFTASTHSIQSISCIPGSVACLALDSVGQVLTTVGGGSWTTPVVADTNGAGVGVACTSAGSCVIIDGVATTRSS